MVGDGSAARGPAKADRKNAPPVAMSAAPAVANSQTSGSTFMASRPPKLAACW